jgi:secreted trypsin-like serine protease
VIGPPVGPENPYTCGVPTIIQVPGYLSEYGQADFGEYPWMAVILSTSNNYLGAGALLDSYHVLTAAHKVQEYKGGYGMKVRLGEWNAQDDSEPHKNVEIDVDHVEIHPGFNSQNLQNDVAVIKLKYPVDIGAYPHIKPVCLPKQGHNYVGKRCWVAGFGKDAFKVGKHSYYLKEVDLPIVDSNECEGRLKSTRLGHAFHLHRKSFLCAGGEPGKDACTGDGGAPLVCQGHNGQFQVVGLVAWGIGCAEGGIPGVYVNIPNFVEWIQAKLY